MKCIAALLMICIDIIEFLLDTVRAMAEPAQVSAMHLRIRLRELERLVSSRRPSDASFAAVTRGVERSSTLS